MNKKNLVSSNSDKKYYISKEVGFFRFKKLQDKFLLTNIVGDYIFLKPPVFQKFIQGKLEKDNFYYKILKNKGFLKDSEANLAKIIIKYRKKHDFLYFGPSLHIIVVTLNCNYQCIYCQASSRYYKNKNRQKFDLDKKTAAKIINFIFKSPNKSLTIEFQGGEPLLNWPVVKFIIERVEQLNKQYHKDILFSLVSNFSLMDENIFSYCRKHNVSLCTSLDGPAELHNINRPMPEGNSYQATQKWIKYIKDDEDKNKNVYKLNALLTVSRASLQYPIQIIDEYLQNGFTGIHLRPLSQLGVSYNNFNQIGYSEEEFFKFWKQALDYIIELNKRKIFFYERGVALILSKIFKSQDPNFMDLRSPCGAGIGQLLYNYDGNIFTCDEGRMLQNNTFLLGNVNKNSYEQIIDSPKLKTVCQASILENLSCDTCVYQPFCGVCPVLNYALYGNIFAPPINTFWCKFHQDMLDYIFLKMQDPDIKSIFKSWVGLVKLKGFKNI